MNKWQMKTEFLSFRAVLSLDMAYISFLRFPSLFRVSLSGQMKVTAHFWSRIWSLRDCDDGGNKYLV